MTMAFWWGIVEKGDCNGDLREEVIDPTASDNNHDDDDDKDDDNDNLIDNEDDEEDDDDSFDINDFWKWRRILFRAQGVRHFVSGI